MKKTNLLTRPIFHFVLIFSLCSIVYSNTLESPFVFDDKFVIVENPIVKDLTYFINPSKAIIHNGHFEYESFKHRYIGYLTFALNYWIHKLDVVGYHLTNLTVHLINSLIVYWIVVLTFRTPFLDSSIIKERSTEIALFSSLLFACHPIQTQAVTYIWQRVTSLSTTFYILSLVLYIIWRLKSSGQVLFKTNITLLYYFGSFISAFLAMKTKEIAFTLPIILFIYELMFFEEKLKKRLLNIAPIFLTMFIIPFSILFSDKLTGHFFVNIGEATRVDTSIPRWDYFLTQFSVIATYIRLIFFPINQNLDYDFQIYNEFLTTEVFLPFLLLISLFGLSIYLLLISRSYNKAYRFISFGIFWFFIALSVESSFIPIVDVIFEHRIYLPSVGLFIALTVSVYLLLNRVRGKKQYTTGVSIFVILIVVFSVLTYFRNNVWSSNISLWQDTVKKSPDKERPHINLGFVLSNQGRRDEAIKHYLMALKINPDSDKAHNNLGTIFNDLERRDLAIKHYLRAISIKPDFVEAYSNLGNVFLVQGRKDEAIELYLKALRIKPDSEETHNNLGNVLLDQGHTDKAIEHYLFALRKNYDFEEAHNNLGNALYKKGSINEAIEHYLKALRIKPDFEEAHLNIGLALSKRGDTDEAIGHYLSAIKINPHSENSHYNLGLAYNNKGNTEKAIEHYLKALRINPNLEKAHNNIGISLYLKGNSENALVHFRKALSINPDFVPAKNNLKKALMQQ